MLQQWQAYSQANSNLDNPLAGCACIPLCRRNHHGKCRVICFCAKSCTCEEKDYQNWLSDFLYPRKFNFPTVRAVNFRANWVLDELGVLQGPHTHSEWLAYSYACLDKFQDICDGEIKSFSWATSLSGMKPIFMRVSIQALLLFFAS